VYHFFFGKAPRWLLKKGDEMNKQKAVFAAGCFWGIEDKFRRLPGVMDARSGYTGGHLRAPTYDQVCAGDSGHAEAVEVVFDPAQVSFDELLSAFWAMHDPTQKNRQGPDVGTQYRSAIFYLDEEQRLAAEKSKRDLEASGKYRAPIATELSAAGEFWPAEEYHQRYLEKAKKRRFFAF
jgi:peptide-methionine (S)-S-oxide reductase